MRSDAIVRFPGASQVVIVTPPATQDALPELVKNLKTVTVIMKSSEFLLKEQFAGDVSVVVICPDTGCNRRQSLKLLFAMVHKALNLFKYAPILLLLPPRDESSRKDLEDLQCRVSTWDRQGADKMASFIIETTRDVRSSALIAVEYLMNGNLRFSHKGSSVTLKIGSERFLAFLRTVLQEERVFSKYELADAMNSDDDQVKVYPKRLNEYLAQLENLLGITLKIVGDKNDTGYRLVISTATDK